MFQSPSYVEPFVEKSAWFPFFLLSKHFVINLKQKHFKDYKFLTVNPYIGPLAYHPLTLMNLFPLASTPIEAILIRFRPAPLHWYLGQDISGGDKRGFESPSGGSERRDPITQDEKQVKPASVQDMRDNRQG